MSSELVFGFWELSVEFFCLDLLRVEFEVVAAKVGFAAFWGILFCWAFAYVDCDVGFEDYDVVCVSYYDGDYVVAGGEGFYLGELAVCC
ncbi:hypothetical protein D3C86_1692220 [compost metagenome]